MAQHKAAKVCQVVLVAAMTLATQLALVTPSVVEFLAAPATWLIQEAPALQESQVVQLVPFHRSRGHPKHQGLVEMRFHLNLSDHFFEPVDGPTLVYCQVWRLSSHSHLPEGS